MWGAEMIEKYLKVIYAVLCFAAIGVSYWLIMTKNYNDGFMDGYKKSLQDIKDCEVEK